MGEFKGLRTFNDLVDWINENVEMKTDTNDTALWYVSIQEAMFVSDYNLKDIAYLFLNGIEPMTPENVDTFFYTQWEDIDFSRTDDASEENRKWADSEEKELIERQLESLKYHFGID